MHGTAWRGDLVAERLIAVFRDISRDIPIYSPQKGVLLRVGAEDRPIDGLNLIASVQRILGQPAAARLLQWARMRATGESIRSFCLESGRNRSIFYYWRKRMLEKVAASLNAERAGQVAVPITRQKRGYR